MSFCCISAPFMVIAMGSGELQVTFRVRFLLHLLKLLITFCKSEYYSTSLRLPDAVVKGFVWGWWYSWARHLESLSSTSERWLKTNVSTTTHHPPNTPNHAHQHTPFPMQFFLRSVAAPDSVFSGQDQLLASARTLSQHTDFWPIFRGSEKFIGFANIKASHFCKYHFNIFPKAAIRK